MASKKQQTLSAFFKTPISVSTNSNAGLKVHQPAENDLEVPVPKRRKVNTAVEDEDEDVEPITSLRPTSGNAQKNRIAIESPSKRTSKYLFSSHFNDDQDEQENAANKRQREDLHRKFVKKLGKPDSIADIKRRNKVLEEDADGEDEDGEEETPAASEKSSGRTRAVASKGTHKLTPMEKQIIDIKRAHMDTVLVVEVGYKFRFFGDDARIAAKELSIVCIPGKFRFDEHSSEAHLDRFASASIPVHRLHVHVKRLVSAGYKVGIVRQLETAALKAVGDNRNAPFVRKLTNLYTKGTYIDDTEGLESERGSKPAQSPATGFLLCITEVNAKGFGNDEKVHVGIVAVQPATGDVIYDDFDDGFMRSEIETRLLHIAPCEILIVGELSKATEKLVSHLSGSKMNVFGDKIRLERTEKSKTTTTEAFTHVSSFYAGKLADTDGADARTAKTLNKLLGLPEHVMICLSNMIKHLAEYGLENVFDLTKYFQPFSQRSHMLLNGNTLTSLEVYQNQTDHSVKGSLFWTLDRTQTRFGSRLLRKWVGRPLLDKLRIEERLTALEEILDSDNASAVQCLRSVLSTIKIDLEKSLLRIYYSKCSRPELLNLLQTLQKLATELCQHQALLGGGFKSPLITNAVTSLPTVLAEVLRYLDRINLQAAKSDDKYSFFQEKDETETVSDHKFGIAAVEADLDAFRSTAAERLGKKDPVNYATVSGIEYLVEVENSSKFIGKVPATWAKISGTKKISRFHPPEVVQLMRERDQHKESLAAACDAAFKDLLAEISTKYQLFRDTILNLATLDCLLALAIVAGQPGYIRPSLVDDTTLNIRGARHPMVEQLLVESYVPNDVVLSNAGSSTRALLVTGPNMGGKSSYVRSVALISIMAQVGSYVPASFAEVGILDAVFTRMGAFDNMMSGESTFMVELSETSDILKLATDRSLVVLDELGRGTSTYDGVAIASSVLDYLVRNKKCLTLFITHYQILARLAENFPQGQLKNVHMRFSEQSDEEVTFLYEVGEGVAHRSYGLNVARLAGLSGSVIATAKAQSTSLENTMRERRIRGVANSLLASTEADESALMRIVEGIEML